MKKKLALLPILGLLSFGSLISFTQNNQIMVKAEEQQVHYVNLGPACLNHNSPNCVESTNPDKYSIAVRGGAKTKNLMLYMNEAIYEGVDFNTPVQSADSAETDLTLIRIYSSPTKFVTAKELYTNSHDSMKMNIYQDAGLHLAIPIYGIDADSIYMITVAEGFVYPYAPSSHDIKYVQSSSVSFKSTKYQSGASDIFYSGEWLTSKELTGAIEEVPIAACSSDRELGHYRVHIRGNEQFGDQELYDNGSCYLIIFFDDLTYNKDIDGIFGVNVGADFFDLSENETSYLNTLYRKIHFTTKDGQQLTLEDIANPSTKGLPIYNLWGENGSIAFKIGNLNYIGVEENYIEDDSYHAMSFSSITIEKGTQFPCYQTTNGSSIKDTRYTQVETVKLDIDTGSSQYWMVRAEYLFSYGDTLVDHIDVTNETVTVEGQEITKPFANIYLTESSYAGLSDARVTTITSDLTKYVYANGRSLLYKNTKTYAFANLHGKTNCLSVSIDNETIDSITEVIVQKGCSIPSAGSEDNKTSVYGGNPYHNVLKTASYDYKDGEYVKSSSIVWTLWFDGANPKRVSNSKYFNMSNATPVEKEGFKFVCWRDADGNKAVGNIQIYSGKEFFAEYEVVHTVTLINGNERTVLQINDFGRLTQDKNNWDKLYPTKDGYRFIKWVDENGDAFNIDNRIRRSMTLTAVFEETGETVKKGCSGSLTMTSLTLSLISAVGCALMLAKKKEEK